MSIVLGFDFGMKHIGVAVGQALTKTATPLAEIKAKDGIPNFEDIHLLIEEWEPVALIVGIPLNMDGTEQHSTHAARKFAKRLKAKFKLDVFEVDERLSSWEAKNRMKDRIKENQSKREGSIHSVAAVVLVEEWLNTHP